MEFPVTGWYDLNGNLWKPNTIVTLISPTLDLPEGVNLLINRVQFSFDSNGTTTVLSLLPPNSFTSEPIEDPWK